MSIEFKDDNGSMEDEEDYEMMCNCYSTGMASTEECEYHPKSLEKPMEVIKSLQNDNWTWHRDPYICNFTSDAQIQGQTVMFHPNFSFGTAAARGEKRLTSRTRAYWEIMIPYCYGTSMMFGIGTDETKMRSPVYFEDILGGTDNNSMGLSYKGLIYRDYCNSQFISSLPDREPSLIGIYFNGPEGTLSYFLNGEPLGIAFFNIDTNNKIYYPMVSSTAQKSQFILIHMYSNLDNGIPPPLFDLCVTKVMDHFNDSRALAKILPMPIMRKVAEKSMMRAKNNYLSFTPDVIRSFQPKCSRCNLVINGVPFQQGLCTACVNVNRV